MKKRDDFFTLIRGMIDIITSYKSPLSNKSGEELIYNFLDELIPDSLECHISIKHHKNLIPLHPWNNTHIIELCHLKKVFMKSLTIFQNIKTTSMPASERRSTKVN
jgi:hypothetical protein